MPHLGQVPPGAVRTTRTSSLRHCL